MARKYFKGRSPIGERFGYDKPDVEIVGVVRDARVNSVRERAEPMVFYPFDATPSFDGSMHVRAAGDPAPPRRRCARRCANRAEAPVARVTTIASSPPTRCGRNA